MNKLVVAMEDALVGIDADGRLKVLRDDVDCRCLAVDPGSRRLYCGTGDRGLLRSSDGGDSWARAGEAMVPDHVTAVAVSRAEAAPGAPATLYAGTEPSAVFRSADGGDEWRRLNGLLELPSAGTWSFPPRPDTHHVRWIEPDPSLPGRLFVAIEAGALVYYGPRRGWRDRVPGSPIDTHTLIVHPVLPHRLYAAAGDGYYESRDGGATWEQPDDGLRHHYAWSCAIDAKADVALLSAADGPSRAHGAEAAESWIYRRADDGAWRAVRRGLPDPDGTTVSSLAVDPARSGSAWAANNHGVYRSTDAGKSWDRIDTDWPERFLSQRVVGLRVLAGA